MRVVQVCPYDPDRHGGVQRNVHALDQALRARGHETLIIAPGTSAEPRAGVWRLGGMRSVAFAGTRFEVTWAGAPDIRRMTGALRAWAPDVVHFHTPWDPLMPWQLFRKLDMPRVATFHDTPPPGLTGAVLRTLFKQMSRYLLGELDGAIAVSAAPLGHLRPGARGVKPVVLPPVTDLSAFFAVEKQRAVPPSILFLGRLEPRKGVSVLLEAAQCLARGEVPLPAGIAAPRFIVAGDGDQLAAVQEAERSLGSRWITHVPSPDAAGQLALLREATLAVSPALYGESFGIVLAEALASGTPVIGADNAGYRTVLTGPGERLLVPAGDALALARRMSELLSDAALMDQLSVWGRGHARQYDVAERVADFEAVYREAIARHARSKREG